MGSALSSDGSSSHQTNGSTLAQQIPNATDVTMNTGNRIGGAFDGPKTDLDNLPSGKPYSIDNTTSNTNINDLTGQQPNTGISSGDNIFNATISSINNETTTITNTATNTSEQDFKINLFGTYIYPFRWLTLSTLYSWLGPLSSLAMIIGCVMPYVPQYITIHKNRNCSGFSTFVCLTLLLANILRIAFWFGHRFELPLLIQSIVMILAQILLLELCVRVNKQRLPQRSRSIFSFKVQYFWRWTNLYSYLTFLIVLTTLLGIATYYLIDCEPFIESLGYCALVTESMLGLPQVIKNYKNKSVEGMSLSMVLMWLAGDTFKTGYFIANAVPYQFWLCGLLQISVDLLILFQVCLFRQNAPIKLKSRVDDSPKEMMAL